MTAYYQPLLIQFAINRIGSSIIRGPVSRYFAGYLEDLSIEDKRNFIKWIEDRPNGIDIHREARTIMQRPPYRSTIDIHFRDSQSNHGIYFLILLAYIYFRTTDEGDKDNTSLHIVYLIVGGEDPTKRDTRIQWTLASNITFDKNTTLEIFFNHFVEGIQRIDRSRVKVYAHSSVDVLITRVKTPIDHVNPF